MTDPPVTTTEIAELLHHIRELSDNPTGNPTERARVLARKADLLARLATQRADEWTCEHADQARQLAHQAQILGTQARDTVTPQQHDTIHE
jgi:hypothetical protein